MMKASMVLAALLSFAACGPPPLPASGVCTHTSECESGLTCMSFAIQNGASCSASQSQVCTKTCTADADCASLTAPNASAGSFSCLAGCSSASVSSSCALLAH